MAVHRLTDARQNPTFYITVRPETEETVPPPNIFVQSSAVADSMFFVFGVCNYTGRLCFQTIKPFEAETTDKPTMGILDIQATGKGLVDRMWDVVSKLPEDENGKTFREELKGLIWKANRWVVEVEETFGDDGSSEMIKRALGGLLGVEEGV